MRVLVMGPGRSGSHYLEKMLKTLGLETIHEETKAFRGQGPAGIARYLEGCAWEDAANWLKEKDGRALCGFPYGFMVYYLRHHVPGLRCICVHRDRASWLKSTNKKSVATTVEGALSYPGGLETKEHYWEIYEHLMLSVTPPVLNLTMKDLNDCKPRIETFLSNDEG